PEDPHRSEEEPDGRVVGERRQHREERLECLGSGVLLLAQANRDEQVGLVTVGLAPPPVADGAVSVPRAALAAVLGGRLRVCGCPGGLALRGGSSSGADEQRHRKTQLPDGSELLHASPSARGMSSEREPPYARPAIPQYPRRICGESLDLGLIVGALT